MTTDIHTEIQEQITSIDNTILQIQEQIRESQNMTNLSSQQYTQQSIQKNIANNEHRVKFFNDNIPIVRAHMKDMTEEIEEIKVKQSLKSSEIDILAKDIINSTTWSWPADLKMKNVSFEKYPLLQWFYMKSDKEDESFVLKKTYYDILESRGAIWKEETMPSARNILLNKLTYFT